MERRKIRTAVGVLLITLSLIILYLADKFVLLAVVLAMIIVGFSVRHIYMKKQVVKKT